MRPFPLRTARRRSVLSAFGAALLSGCSASERGGSNAVWRSNGPASPQQTPVRTLPTISAYAVLSGEVEPGCKSAAAAAITAAFTWPADRQAPPLDERLSRVGAMPSFATGLNGLLMDHFASTLEIRYPQYGGLGDGRKDASIIVVAKQTWLPSASGEPQTRDFTVDVRLRRNGPQWAAETAYVPTIPTPTAASDARVQRLLQNQAVLLPSAARADLAGGMLHPPLIDLLETLSQRWRIHVQVFRSGHPRNVYGTSRVSNHTLGRAVDIWALDGVPIIAQPRSVWSAVMTEAERAGASEIGGPGLVSGQGPYFTNDVHKDHIHIGFDPT